MCVALTSLSLLTRRLAVVAFGMWLCGAGCALCCTPSVSIAQAQTPASTSANAATSEEAASAPYHCPTHARASQDEADGSGPVSARKHSPVGYHADRCCARTGQTLDAARKQHPTLDRADGHTRADFSWMDACTHEVSRPTSRGRSPDGRTTHVRCCVFLI